MGILALIKLPDYVTLASVVCGLSSIILASRQNFVVAALLMLAAVFFDWADGEVAGLIKRQGKFGAELDSLADAISFGTVPVFFVYFLGVNDLLAIIVFLLFTSASVLRLARFNIIEKTPGYYIGLPTTVNGVMIPVLYFLFSWLNISGETARWLYLVYLVLASYLMVSSVKTPTLKLIRPLKHSVDEGTAAKP